MFLGSYHAEFYDKKNTSGLSGDWSYLVHAFDRVRGVVLAQRVEECFTLSQTKTPSILEYFLML